MIITGQPFLHLSVHNRFVITFTNTDVQTRTFAHQLVTADSQTHLVFIARTNDRATHSFLCPSQHKKLLSPVLLLPALRYHVLGVSALYRCAELCSGHPQPSLSGTGALWVSNGTHQCVDPPRQGGGSTMRQTSGCCSAAALH